MSAAALARRVRRLEAIGGPAMVAGIVLQDGVRVTRWARRFRDGTVGAAFEIPDECATIDEWSRSVEPCREMAAQRAAELRQAEAARRAAQSQPKLALVGTSGKVVRG